MSPEQQVQLLLTTLMIVVGLPVLIMMMRLMIKSIFPHEALVRFRRQNGEQVKRTRFRIVKSRKDDLWYVTTLRYKIKVPKPSEDYMSMLSKKSMFAEIIVPDNGQAYFLKPNYNKIGEVISYGIQDRDIEAWAKVEIREAVNKYQFTSKLQNLMPLIMLMIILLTFAIGAIYVNKMTQKAIDASKEVAASNAMVSANILQTVNATNELVSKLSNLAPGGIYNPLPYPNGVTG